jgi:hypothetical protein
MPAPNELHFTSPLVKHLGPAPALDVLLESSGNGLYCAGSVTAVGDLTSAGSNVLESLRLAREERLFQDCLQDSMFARDDGIPAQKLGAILPVRFGGTGVGAQPAARSVLALDGSGGYEYRPAEPASLAVAGGSGPTYVFEKDPQNSSGMTVTDGVTTVSLPLPTVAPTPRPRPPAPSVSFRRVAVSEAYVDVLNSESGSETRVATYSGAQYEVAGAPVTVSEVVGSDGPVGTQFSNLGPPAAGSTHPVSVTWDASVKFHRVAALALMPNGAPGFPARLYFTSDPPAATAPADPAAASGTQVILPEIDVTTGPESAEVYSVILRSDGNGNILDEDGVDASPQPAVAAQGSVFPAVLDAADSLSLWFELRGSAAASPHTLAENAAGKVSQGFIASYLARSQNATPPGGYVSLQNVQSFFYRPLVFIVDAFDNVSCVDFGDTFLPSSGVAVAVVRATADSARVIIEFPEGIQTADLKVLTQGTTNVVYSASVTVAVSPVGSPVSRVDFREDPTTNTVSLADTSLRRGSPSLVPAGNYSYLTGDYIYSGTSLSLDDGTATAAFEDTTVHNDGADTSVALSAWFLPPPSGFGQTATLLALSLAEGGPGDPAPYWTAEVSLQSRMTPTLTVSLRDSGGTIRGIESVTDGTLYSEEMLGSWHHAAVSLAIDYTTSPPSAVAELAIDGGGVPLTVTMSPQSPVQSAQQDRVLKASLGPAPGFLLDDIALYAPPDTPSLGNASRFTTVDIGSGSGLEERKNYVVRLTTTSVGSLSVNTHDRAFATQDSTAPQFSLVAQELVAGATAPAEAETLRLSWQVSPDTTEVIVGSSADAGSVYSEVETIYAQSGPNTVALNPPWEDTHVRLTARDSASDFRRESNYETELLLGSVVPAVFPSQEAPPGLVVQPLAKVGESAYEIGLDGAIVPVRVQDHPEFFFGGTTPVPAPDLRFALMTQAAYNQAQDATDPRVFTSNAIDIISALGIEPGNTTQLQ